MVISRTIIPPFLTARSYRHFSVPDMWRSGVSDEKAFFARENPNFGKPGVGGGKRKIFPLALSSIGVPTKERERENSPFLPSPFFAFIRFGKGGGVMTPVRNPEYI